MAPVPTLEADFVRWAEACAHDGGPTPRQEPPRPPSGGAAGGRLATSRWLAGLLAPPHRLARQILSRSDREQSPNLHEPA